MTFNVVSVIEKLKYFSIKFSLFLSKIQMRIFQNFNKPILIARLKLANEIAPKVPLSQKKKKNALKKHKLTTKVMTFSKKS